MSVGTRIQTSLFVEDEVLKPFTLGFFETYPAKINLHWPVSQCTGEVLVMRKGC